MHADAVHVADDQERGILQRLAVEQELVEGRIQVLPLPLVLPAEELSLPHVGLPAAAATLVGAALEGEPLASRIGLGGLRVFQHFAEVEEMLL